MRLLKVKYSQPLKRSQPLRHLVLNSKNVSAVLILLLLLSCDRKPVVFRDIYSIPEDIDSNDLIRNGFSSIGKKDNSFFPPKRTGTFYFCKLTSDYEIIIVLKNNNSEGLKAQRIDLKKDVFERITGKESGDYPRVVIHGTPFSVTENRHTNQVHLYRTLNATRH